MSRIWRCGQHALSLERPLVMGILNVTPDSFSDGGRFVAAGRIDVTAAVEAGRSLLEAGADVIDIGGESTRPGAEPVSLAEELERVLPVVEVLAEDGAVVSIDTRHADVARVCVDAGAAIVNDVSGFRDPDMVAVAASSEAGLVVMHMLGEPRTMQTDPRYDDVVAEVAGYLHERAAALETAGVACERIALDPGIGFGKTTAHNLELLRRLDELATLGYPVVLGASRKRFVGEVTGVEAPRDRVAGSVAVAVWAALHGADVLRVHDVDQTVEALLMTGALLGDREMA